MTLSPNSGRSNKRWKALQLSKKLKKNQNYPNPKRKSANSRSPQSRTLTSPYSKNSNQKNLLTKTKRKPNHIDLIVPDVESPFRTTSLSTVALLKRQRKTGGRAKMAALNLMKSHNLLTISKNQ